MIYLDYNVRTPIDKEVAESMHPFLYGNFGNPASNHPLGIAAKKAIENARQQVATNTLNISFLGYNGYEILEKLENTAVSTGSACYLGMAAISAVLKVMGVSENVGRGTVRFSLGQYTTENEIYSVIESLKRVRGAEKKFYPKSE